MNNYIQVIDPPPVDIKIYTICPCCGQKVEVLPTQNFHMEIRDEEGKA
jgi:hypothetical protein